MHSFDNEEGEEEGEEDDYDDDDEEQDEEANDEAEEPDKAKEEEYVNPIPHLLSHILYHLPFSSSSFIFPLEIFMRILITPFDLKISKKKYMYLVQIWIEHMCIFKI